MSSLRICLAGGFQSTRKLDIIADAQITRNARDLLAYLLLCEQRIHPREMWARPFGSDHSQACSRSYLSSALRRLRFDWWIGEEWRVKSEFRIFPIAMG